MSQRLSINFASALQHTRIGIALLQAEAMSDGYDGYCLTLAALE